MRHPELFIQHKKDKRHRRQPRFLAGAAPNQPLPRLQKTSSTLQGRKLHRDRTIERGQHSGRLITSCWLLSVVGFYPGPFEPPPNFSAAEQGGADGLRYPITSGEANHPAKKSPLLQGGKSGASAELSWCPRCPHHTHGLWSQENVRYRQVLGYRLPHKFHSKFTL